MNPISPVIKGRKETVWAKDQPEYLPLPAVVSEDGRVITKWKLSPWERIVVFFRGTFYHEQLNFGSPLQPVRLVVDEPDASVFGRHITAPSVNQRDDMKVSYPENVL